MKQQKSILLLQNNSSVAQPASLFTTNPNLSGAINGVNNAWDISSLVVLFLTSLQLQVKPLGSSTFVTLSAAIGADTAQAIATALNTLNVGFFYVVVSGGKTLIRTTNRLFQFGTLTVNQNLSSWITTGTLQVNNLAVTSIDFSNLDTVTSTTLADFSSTASPPYGLSLVSSTPYATSKLNAGDNIRVILLAGPPGVYTILYTIRQNGTIILNSSFSGFRLILNFPYVLNATYDFQLTVN